MRYGKRWLLCIIVACAAIAQEVEKDEQKVQDCTVYVLLDKKESQGEEAGRISLWSMTSPHGFVIRDLFREQRYEKLTSPELHFEAKGAALYINGKRVVNNRVIIAPQDGVIHFQENSYAGKLYLLYQDEMWYLVNGVDLEEYVCGVLRCESWPGWSLETNKVFAIVFRSYVVSKLLEARGKRRMGRGFLYDVLNTNAHQTYKGTHSVAVLRQATEETRGMVLAYNNKPIEAMYDTCCGGVIPADMKGVNFQSAPYLRRPYPCTYCAKSKVYSWRASYTMDEVTQLIRSVDATIKKIDSIKVSKKDKAGVVHELDIRSGKRSVKISGRKAYSLFKDIKSSCFSVVVKAGKCLFRGDGYGHNIGLCQWGAHEMVKRGEHWTRVLPFFYPGTRVMKLEVMR